MKNTTAPKARGITISRLTHAEALAGVRKVAVPASRTFRDKRNDYQRKPKFFTGHI